MRDLLVEDRRGLKPTAPGTFRTIRARRFVVAAGARASTQLLHQSLRGTDVEVRGLGERLAANVTCPLFAVYDQPIYRGSEEYPEPGITQCFYVERRRRILSDGRTVEEPTLENWFHFPGTVSLALAGWFQEWVQVMRKYHHLAICGMVAPAKVRPQNRVTAAGAVELELDDEEFELILHGLERIGRIYLASASPTNRVTLYLPTRGVLLDRAGRPFHIRSRQELEAAITAGRRRGPAFLSLTTAHLQGGNALGTVVNPRTFRLMTAAGEDVENLYVADASLFSEGCDVNPQLTLKALAHMAADRLLEAKGEG